MAVTDLELQDGGVLNSFDDGSFIPANGAGQVFNVGIAPALIDDDDWLFIDIVANGPGLTSVTLTAFDAATGDATITAVSDGVTSATVRATLEHSSVR